MKRWLSMLTFSAMRSTLIVLAASLSLILAGSALSQVPAALVRSGIIIGTASAQGSSNVLGTATWNPSGASIGSLYTSGIVTGVTYSSAGNYAVTVSGSPTNYVVTGSVVNGASIGFVSVATGTYSSSGFTVLTAAINPVSVVDFNLVTIAVIKQ